MRVAVTTAVLGERGGAPLRSFRIDNGILQVEVWDRGATLVAVEVPDGTDGRVSLVLRPEPPAGADGSDRGGYVGATIGRYANRIAGSRFELGGEVHSLTTNEGPNHLHGGRDGFDQRVWAPELGDDEVTFTLVSPDGDQGYPGRLTASVRYRIDRATLEIAYAAVTDAPTVVNLTNHAYWNLAGGGTVTDHEITVRAGRWLPVDDASIPTGEIAAVEGTRFDLRRPQPLADLLRTGGLDHCFLLDGADEVRDVATLSHPPSGRSMVVATDQPALQVYTANHMEPPYTAVCLETQRPPNAPNEPGLGPSVLHPGDTYRHRTTHTFDGPGIE